MRKLKRAAATAVALTCLSSTIVSASFTGMGLGASVINAKAAGNGSTEALVGTANREVAGLAAILNGKIDIIVPADTDPVLEADALVDSETEASAEGAEEQSTVDAAIEAAEEKIVLTPDVSVALNIRKSADEDGELAGQLFRGCTADVIALGEEWTEIASGDVTGFVSSEYILTGEEAGKFLESLDPSVAKVTAKSLNLRQSASTDSTVLSVIDKNDQFMVLSQKKGWVEIQYTSKISGFVSADYVEITKGAGQAVSIEKLDSYEKKADDLAAERAEAKRAKEEAEKAKARKEAEKKSSSDKKPEKSGKPSESKRPATSASSSDEILLAALVRHEAGTNYANCLAVANVVLNRVKSSKYPNSIRGVIYQKGQFSGVNRGVLNKYLNGKPNATCLKAARAALAGSNNVGSRLQFRSNRILSPKSKKNAIAIGDNVFF